MDNLNKTWKNIGSHPVGSWGDIMIRNATFHPNRDAFICADRRLTFRQYNERVNRLIHGLKDRGINNGDTIGVLSWNCLEYAEVYGAAGKGGFLAAPLNARASANEIEYLVNDSDAVVLFVGPEFAGTVLELKPKLRKVKYMI